MNSFRIKNISLLLFFASTLVVAQSFGVSPVKKIEGFSHPESVVLDKANDVVYVSNIGGDTAGDGYISKVSTDGEILESKWISGLNDPKGLLVKDGKLYVTDNTEFVEMDISDEKITKTTPVENAVFLNDIAVAEDGSMYISDSGKSSIFKVDNSGEISEWMNTEELEFPNGLLVRDNRLYVAAWGSENPGNLLKVNPETKEISRISKEGIGNLDGIQGAHSDSFFLSDWATGKIYEVDLEGNKTEMLTSEKSAGDILFLMDEKKFMLPMNLQNSLYLYELE